MKIFVFAAVAVAFLQLVSGDTSDDCRNFRAEHACDKCDFSRSYVQYVRNPCNCTEYFSCEKTRGYITAHKQACQPCLCFSDKTWGCTDPNPDGGDCPTEAPITEIVGHHYECCYRYGNGPSGLYLQRYQEAEGDDFEVAYKWIVNEFPVTMPCPPGTWFNFTECKCVHCVPGHRCAGADPKIACFDFSDFDGSKKVWYDAAPSCSVSSPWASPPHALQLGGSCDLEVPFFQKNQFSEFTLCTAFRSTGNGPAGLAFDGGRPSDDCHPSISLGLDGSNNVIAEIFTGSVFSINGPTVNVGSGGWFSACLRYNGKTLELIVGDLYGGPFRSFSVPAWGSTNMNNCNMLIGANIDQFSGVHQFFHGELSKWCFARSYLDPIPHDMMYP